MFLCCGVQTGEPSFRPPPSFVLTPAHAPRLTRFASDLTEAIEGYRGTSTACAALLHSPCHRPAPPAPRLDHLNRQSIGPRIFRQHRRSGELYLLMLTSTSCVRLTDNSMLTRSRSPVSMLYIYLPLDAHSSPAFAVHLSLPE